MSSAASIPAEAQRAADRGELIEAMKITREVTGLGLKEAKEAVDFYVHGRKPALPPGDIPLSAIVSLQDGKLADAVRLTRETGSLQLKDAYDAVHAYLDANQGIREQYLAARKKRGGGWRRFLLPLIIALICVAFALSAYPAPR